MGGVYGNFLDVFPELKRRFVLWDKDKTYENTIIAVYFDEDMIGMTGIRMGRRNVTAVDIKDDGMLYVGSPYIEKVHIGDYFKHPMEQTIMRVTKRMAFDFAAGYATFHTERLTGTTPEQTGELKVKEPEFV